jgi:hypothetical protein
MENIQYQNNLQVDSAAAGALGAVFAGVFLFLLLIVLVCYIYFAICEMKIAKKTNTSDGWMAWLPILNIYLMVKIAQKPSWWLLLMFIPLVNIIIGVILWAEISKRLGKPEWLGLLVLIPVANIVLPGYLAFSDSSPKRPPANPAPAS